MAHIVTHYTAASPKITQPLTLAVVCDLHNGPYDDVMDQLAGADAIIIGGDLVNRHQKDHRRAAAFLQDAPRLAPTFYAIGNHERRYENMDAFWPVIRSSDAVLLDNRWVSFAGITLGALSSTQDILPTNLTVVDDMERQPGFRLLVCHHPEYFRPLIKPRDIDLTIAGHAHGGQVALFGHPLYAPNQGFFPKLTQGMCENGRLLISRGMTNSARAPRIGVPKELVMLHLQHD